MSIKRTGLIAAGVLAVATLALTACSSGDPLSSKPADTSASAPIVVGSAAFPENEILAYIYSDALNDAGIKSTVKPNIGQRDAYIAALKDGSIDLVPEYSGNLLQYLDKTATAQSSDDVFAALPAALPAGFEVLDQSTAQDADSYNVTKEFADTYKLKSLADLKNVTVPIAVGANPEFATRPYGIPGLKSVYGVNATLTPISDSGGPQTLAALLGGQVQLADIYTTTPSIKQNNLVTLADPEHLILAQNVVPLINSKKATAKVKSVLDKVQKTLTTEDLIDVNTQSSTGSKLPADQIAKNWVKSKGL